MKMLTLTVLLFACGNSGSSAAAPATPGTTCVDFDQSHAAWGELLARHVKAGEVDYTGLRTTSRPAFDAYLHTLEGVCRTRFDTWSPNEQLAFWIDAYNAYTIRFILDHWPIDSIRAYGVLPGAAFREAFIPLGALHGPAPGKAGLVSLNDLENEILRKDFAEPRIHFAIVCASKSCPELRFEAYRADRVNAQLDDAARRFLADPAKNRFEPATKTYHLSPIFDWFEGDFERAAGSVPAFVRRFAPPEAAAALTGGGAEAVKVDFQDYDWSLNGR